MAKEKQHVFSARTTEEGLSLLNGVKARLNIGWDELVIDAVCDRYGLDRAMMAPPRKDRPIKEAPPVEQPPVEPVNEERPTDTSEERPPEEPAKKRKGGNRAGRK
jgi:hypothetical protein